MKLFLIDIHWSRRRPMPGMESSGVTTYRTRAASLTKASLAASNNFRRQHGAIHQIDRIAEKPDPAGIFADGPARVDCGSGQDFGICKSCGHGHGFVLMQSGQ
jgi:hypothetical protein